MFRHKTPARYLPNTISQHLHCSTIPCEFFFLLNMKTLRASLIRIPEASKYITNKRYYFQNLLHRQKKKKKTNLSKKKATSGGGKGSDQ